MKKAKPLASRLTRKNSVLWCEVNIGSLTFKVYLASTSLEELCDAVGYCDQDSGIILVRWELPADNAEATLMHELMHAAIYASAVRLHSLEELDDDDEEMVVHALGAVMYDALHRNGMLTFPPRPKLPGRASV